MNKKFKKVGALVLGGLVIASGAGILGATAFPKTVEVEKVVTEYVDVPGPVQIKNNTVIKEVEKIVEVDNGHLDTVLEHIYDNDGSIEYITEDLDDDELDLIVERVSFVNDVKALAVAEVKSEAIDLLHKELVGEVKLDEDDIERLKIYDDADEIALDDIDFEDLDADAYVNVRFEQDDVDYVAEFKVEIKDGIVDDIDLESVALKE